MNHIPDDEPARKTVASEPQPAATSHRPIDYRMRSLLASFGYAFAGLWYLLRTQRNAQIHCLIGACALALALVLRLERSEWLVLLLTITLVLVAEGINTAIEAAVDVATSEYHPQARIAKDVGAGAVLLTAIMSVIVGCVLFLPHLWPRLVALVEALW